MKNLKILLVVKRVFYSTLVFVLVLSPVIISGEIIVRSFIKIPTPPYDNKEKNPLLGWMPKTNYHFNTECFPNNKRGVYPVHLNFQQHGFRKWSEVSCDSTKKTVFFIGDSYIESLQCSDESVFFSIIADSLPLRVFAFGSSGYGTTQEFLILKQFMDSIKPDFVVLEMCQNDFADNYWRLEEASSYKVGQRRPYLTLQNSIEYHHAHYWIEDIKEYSRFISFILTRVKNVLYKCSIVPTSTEGDLLMAKHKLEYEPYRISYELTGNILMGMKNFIASHKANFLVFDADNFEPTAQQIKDLCFVHNIQIIENIAEAVSDSEAQGDTVRSYDGYHWNDKGHKIVAQKMVDYFRKKSLLDRK